MRLGYRTDRHREIIDRIAQSKTFAHSETSSRLLKYLAEFTFRGSKPPKEYTIAIDLLHRSSEFDPRIDSVVRVQIGRLREKLREYSESEGRAYRIRVEIPKGNHSVVFRKAGPESYADRPFPHKNSWFDWRNLAIGILSALCIFLAVRVATSEGPRERQNDPYLVAFWSELLHDDAGPLVSYSNARFVGNSMTGMRYFDAERDSEEDIIDHYTGVGEAYAVRDLANLFNHLGRQFRLQRASILSWDEAKLSDLVLIGAASENSAVNRLRSLRSFDFQFAQGITNERPQPGEPDEFCAAKDLDYAWLHLGPGFVPGRRILVLAGLTTLGTQAAVESVTRPDFIRELYSELGIAPGQPVPSFEAVIKVNISGGVPINSSLVALHHAEEASPETQADHSDQPRR